MKSAQLEKASLRLGALRSQHETRECRYSFVARGEWQTPSLQSFKLVFSRIANMTEPQESKLQLKEETFVQPSESLMQIISAGVDQRKYAGFWIRAGF
jgi:hypothetical protein